jgi:outer membrane protein TolC
LIVSLLGSLDELYDLDYNFFFNQLMKLRSCFAAISLIISFSPQILQGQETEIMSIYSSVRRALRENSELKGELESVRISDAQIRRELSEFGWGLEALARYEDRSKPQNTREFIAVGGVQLPGNESRIFDDENLTSRFGVKKKYGKGTVLEVGSRFSRLSNTLNRTSANALFSPEYETFTGITITQPLLRGFGKDANLAGVNIAKLRGTAQEILTHVKAMNLVAEVATRYTDIVTADRVLDVHGQNIKLAEQMLVRNKELLKSKEGLATDVTTAELALYQRQDQYITSAAEKIERVNTLFALTNREPDLEGKTKFKPSSAFFSGETNMGKRELISYGQKRRLDISYYNHVVETTKLNVLRARDSGRAQLNLAGSAGLYGVDADGGGAFGEAANAQGREWSLGLDFKMPLNADANDSALKAAEAQVRKAELELQKAKRSISLEVHTACTRMEAAKQRIQTAKKAVELATERLKQEQDLFNAGEGDFYRVVELQQILGDSKVNLVASEAALSKSVIAVWLAAGQIFERIGISNAEIQVMVTRAKAKR